MSRAEDHIAAATTDADAAPRADAAAVVVPPRSRAANFGPMPGASLTQAADILAGELACRTWPYLPEAHQSDDGEVRAELPGEHPLAARSLLARTLGMLEGIGVDAGPRGFVVRSGTTALSARLQRAVERATDLVETQWADAGWANAGKATAGWASSQTASSHAAGSHAAGSHAAGSHTAASNVMGAHDAAAHNATDGGAETPHLIIPLLGPATLSYRVELAGGMPAITDAGARRDLGAALVELAGHAVEDAERRFHVPTSILIVDPAATAAVAGTLPGVTDFDTIRPIGADHMAAAWQRIHSAATEAHRRATTPTVSMVGSIGAFLTGVTDPGTWALAAQARLAGLWVPTRAVEGVAALDGIAAAADAGLRIGLGITRCGDYLDEDQAIPRKRAVELAALVDEMQLGRQWLAELVDVLPGHPLGETSMLDAAHQLACARRTAEMLVRDAGDL